ncbi:MAG: crossover junction endodeoxyribonuclease RuvC [Bacteroidota bacterium]
MEKVRVLGIDPGSIVCGYGVLDYENGRYTLVEYGVVKAKMKSEDLPGRLKEIFIRLTGVIERTNPDISVFETTFYSKNPQSLTKLSHARSAAMLAALMKGVAVCEYSPREVKKSVTGRGNAAKEQVQYMIRKLLSIDEKHKFYDATDALAVAVCHTVKAGTINSNGRSWEDFIRKNPGRVIKE